MIITISGKAGSGKSTIAKQLAYKLNLKHYSVGDMMRELAIKKGMSIIEFSKFAEDNPKIDKQLDDYQIRLSKEDNFIIDGRISFHFIPNSIKIFLEVKDETAVKRISKAKRKTEQEVTIAQLKARRDSEKKRYKKLYNIDPYKKSNYDIVIDTTKLSINEVLNKILKYM